MSKVTQEHLSEVERLRAECAGYNEAYKERWQKAKDLQDEMDALVQRLDQAQVLLHAYDQPVRVAIKMLERTLSATALEISLELKRCLGDSCDLLATAQHAEVKS